MNADGTITYAPDADYNGPDSFDYTISDGHGGTATATVHITVTALNDAPPASDDAYATDEDTQLSISAPGVLENDSDVEGDSLTVTDATDPLHGAVTVNPDGSFAYTPDDDYFGQDSFDYTVSDGHGGGDVGTVTLTVNGVSDPPRISIDPSTQARQYSDGIAEIHAWAFDADEPLLGGANLVRSANGYHLTMSYDPDPIWNSLTVTEDYTGPTKHLWIRGPIKEPAGTYLCTINVSDDEFNSNATSRIVVTSENASIASVNVQSARTVCTSGKGAVQVKGQIAQAQDGALGDLSLAVVHVKLVPIGGGILHREDRHGVRDRRERRFQPCRFGCARRRVSGVRMGGWRLLQRADKGCRARDSLGEGSWSHVRQRLVLLAGDARQDNIRVLRQVRRRRLVRDRRHGRFPTGSRWSMHAFVRHDLRTLVGSDKARVVRLGGIVRSGQDHASQGEVPRLVSIRRVRRGPSGRGR